MLWWLRGSRLREPSKGELDVPLLRRYIAYAKKTCSPRLTETAVATLQNYYVHIRQVRETRRKPSRTSLQDLS